MFPDRLRGPSRSLKRKDDFLLLLVLLVAAILRFYRLGELSLSNDELSALVRTRFDSLTAMYRGGAFLDGHPAGVQVFLFYWTRWFGESAFVLRLPFVLFSLGSVYLVYRIGSCWYHRTAGLLAAASVATFEYPLLYSVLARSYSPGLFFTLCAVYAWTLLVENWRASGQPDSRTRIGFSLALALGVHTHYFTVLLLAMVCLTGFFLVPRGKRIAYLLLCSAGALSFLPELPFFFDLLQVGGLGNWLGEPGTDFLLQFGRTALNGSAAMVVLIVIGLRVFGNGKVSVMRWGKWHTVSLLWFLLSFSIAYGYSLLVQPILQASTLLFVYPFLLLALFSVVPDRTDQFSWRLWPFVIVLLLGSYVTVIQRDFYSRPPFGVFKDVAEDLSGWHHDHGRLPVVVNVVNPDYIGYYFDRLPDPPKETCFKVETPAELARLREWVDTCTADYFAYGWSNNFHPYEIERIIRRRYPQLVAVHHYFNAESWLFGRAASSDPVAPVRKWYQGYNDTTLTGFSIRFDSSAVSPPGSMDFHEGVDYAPDLHDRFAVPAEGLTLLHGSVWYKSVDTTGNQVLVLSFDHEGKNVWWESVRLNDYNMHPGTWQQVFLSKPVPSGYDSLDIKVYLWNPDGRRFQADDLQAELLPAVDPYVRK